MSKQHVNAYRNEIANLRAVSGSVNESTLREAFKDLLKRWARSHDLTLVPEHQIILKNSYIVVDGALVDQVRLPFGYWEAKDENDNLSDEIRKKTARGYPTDNIIYEDTRTAILIQGGKEVDRAPLQGDYESLLSLLDKFFDYERPEIQEFRNAAAQFKVDLPNILSALRQAVVEAERTNYAYAAEAAKFLDHARTAINPAVSQEDIREMLIQHILTEEIFTRVFDNADYHRENNIAQRLDDLEKQFFTGDLKRRTSNRLRPYYAAIRRAADSLASRSEKQGFLKGLYEDFYRVYNPKAADRLGVVYTPAEIVRFMIRGADWLCERHFDTALIEPQVEILDPATGTGTYIVELIEHFRGDLNRMRYKYKNELHANEVAILPYYVANLNIEATYAAIAGRYDEFPGLVFVDTLDNTEALGVHSGHQHALFGAMSDENMDRIKRQNARKISVIIGNPPYNANQHSESDNNKNRTYPKVDKRIKDTYVKLSSAQKTKRYDMYSRFIRWSTDRLADDGVLAFITNRSYIDSEEADGFRKLIQKEYEEAWIIDLGGDYKRKDFAGGGNVFNIGTGVAIGFWVKRAGSKKCKIYYSRLTVDSGEDKLTWLGANDLEDLTWTTVRPTPEGDWFREGRSYPEDAISLASKAAKQGLSGSRNTTIFELFSLGVVTNRDDWVYDRCKTDLRRKIKYLLAIYNPVAKLATTRAKANVTSHFLKPKIKWTRALKNSAVAGKSLKFSESHIRTALFRPYVTKLIYFDPSLNEVQYQQPRIFPSRKKNLAILVGSGKRGDFAVLASRVVPSLDLFLPNACQTLSRYRYTKSGEQIDNITDWSLAQFRQRYREELRGRAQLTRDDIFAYIYAALHDPVYRETYASNLKRGFPRVILHDGFTQWAEWGHALLRLHADFEKVKPWKLGRSDKPGRTRAVPKLKSKPEEGVIVLDSRTELSDIPPAAWNYRLGNRSAIDWVLDQHKEKAPRDYTLPEDLNRYEFADYKEDAIILLAKVVRVSVETVKITEAMRALTGARAK